MHARELVLQVYRFANGEGVDIANPAEALARKAYATFVPRERNLSRHEIKTLLDGLQKTGTAPTLRLAVRFLLPTGVRKGEFIGATWAEVDWERAQWLIPADRMKAGESHGLPRRAGPGHTDNSPDVLPVEQLRPSQPL